MDYNRLYQLAFIDSMTSCYNRNWLEENRNKLNKQELNIALIDLNDLKSTNDTKGHQAGDERIIQLAIFLKTYGRVIRLGGDEFVLFIKNSKFQTFKKECEGKDFSYGIVNKSKERTLRDALAEADKKMYNMKKNR